MIDDGFSIAINHQRPAVWTFSATRLPRQQRLVRYFRAVVRGHSFWDTVSPKWMPFFRRNHRNPKPSGMARLIGTTNTRIARIAHGPWCSSGETHRGTAISPLCVSWVSLRCVEEFFLEQGLEALALWLGPCTSSRFHQLSSSRDDGWGYHLWNLW